ncbi:MAG: hypothetical protein JWP75_3223 [Frondihabitans sp.]|nr:hypothetical protein [Frondihabitans sp.]
MTSSAPRAGSVYTQTDFRRYLAILGGLLVAFGTVAALAGHTAAQSAYAVSPVPTSVFLASADTAYAWMWIGVGSLVFGGVSLLIQLFIVAYRRDDTPR